MSKAKDSKGIVKEVRDGIDEINITKGMAKAMGGSVCTCSGCNLAIPRYRGRYPQKCPDCDTVLVYQTGMGHPSTEV